VIKVSARKEDDTRAGSNTLEISAGSSKHMNLDKKKNFLYIKLQRLTKFSGSTRVKLTCNDVKNTLNGSGICKVFVGDNNMGRHLAVTCDGNKVIAY